MKLRSKMIKVNSAKKMVHQIETTFVQDFKKMFESKEFITNLYETYKLYMENGSRSSKKVDYFHNFIKTKLENVFSDSGKYSIVLEKNIPSITASGFKKCDVVVYKETKPYIVFPVKLVMTNYKQNKNNSWENLTGEVLHLKLANPMLNIVPINIYMDKTPYLKSNKIISKFENITYDDIKHYDILKSQNFVYDYINYIINIEHDEVIIGEEFSKLPKLLYFNKSTPYRTFQDILHKLL